MTRPRSNARIPSPPTSPTTGRSSMAEATLRVSVVVPVRNRRRLLRRLLDALAAQTFDDFEVIVVDDGSTDGSVQEAEIDRASGRPVRPLGTPAGGRCRRAGP